MTRGLASLVLSCLVVAGCGPAGADGDDGHRQIDPKRVHHFAMQHVTVAPVGGEGRILAIGGGGEGVMGRLEGARVVAIDIVERELAEAPPGPLKIVMDARDLKFLDGSFPTAASFFTLMYVRGEDHAKVFSEVFRVLESGGRFLVWDTLFGPPPEGKDVAVVRLEISLPGSTVETGYGVSWPAEVHDLAYFRSLAETSGFRIAAERTSEDWFFLELAKP